ncbi:IS21 family transposase [Streptomyces virginiae]|uniref:IS21 family transposase n=1 Tax=Streptomyces virginiae TaxID=1961 RepID=UPI0036EA20A4
MPGSKVELYAAIRRDARDAGLSSRALALKYSVGRRTVALALESAWPTARKRMPPRGSRLDPYKLAIDGMLRADLDAPRKQRHTLTRIFHRLLDEYGTEEVSYAMVRDYVFDRRREIRVEEGRGPPASFIPQSHRPGDEAEVDFGDVWINLAGTLTKCFLFSLRLSYSGRSVHKIFASCGQEAFLEGHVHALNTLGGVPYGKIRYDNLRAAVAQVLGLTRRRVESERWTAFRSHYSITSFYCHPGIEGAHEKGGVEGQIGWFRRNHLVPVPQVATLAELNLLVEQWDRRDNDRRIRLRPKTIGEYFQAEHPLLVPLPDEVFETGFVSSVRVDRYGQVSARTNHYSVPVRLIGQMVRIVLHASELVVYDGPKEVARHERLIAKGGSRLDLDHYLEALVRKPGAFPGATALEQARSAGKFTPVHDAWWQAACKAHGDPEGTRALISVLLLHRHMAHEDVVAGIATALKAGALTADAVALEARKAADTDARVPAPHPEQAARPVEGGATVTSLTARRLAALPPDPRPLPSVAAYDELLRLRRRHAGPSAQQGES